MPKMGSGTRKKLRRLLVKRDGKHCAAAGCMVKGTFRRTRYSRHLPLLVIDHIDNDNSNNDPKNLQLLCRSCNALKNPRGKQKRVPVVSVLRNGDMPATMVKNLSIEKKAKAWMHETLIGDRSLLKAEVVQRLAFKTDASVVTIERWLLKSVVNEEPECRYRTRMDDDENIWIELKPEYRKAQA